MSFDEEFHHECNGIQYILENVFDKYLYKLYHSLATKDRWDKNIREFIKFHKVIDIGIDIDTSSNLSKYDVDEIKEQGYLLLTGDKGANVDEDEIDGPNDLSFSEWMEVDDIIVYYYHYYFSSVL